MHKPEYQTGFGNEFATEAVEGALAVCVGSPTVKEGASMKRDYIDFQDRSQALAYLITFRTYGTWLHGDERGSMDRREYNLYGRPDIAPNSLGENRDRNLMKSQVYELNAEARHLVEAAIREVCDVRDYGLFGLSIRTNHAHIVVSAARAPEFMMNSFKSYATRKLRSVGAEGRDVRIWSRHGSTRYLWTQEHVDMAIDYVTNGQGGVLPTFD